MNIYDTSNSENIIMKTCEHVITWRHVMKTPTPLTDLGLSFLALPTSDRKPTTKPFVIRRCQSSASQ